MEESSVSLLSGLLVPVSTFLILQSVFGELDWAGVRCLELGAGGHKVGRRALRKASSQNKPC